MYKMRGELEEVINHYKSVISKYRTYYDKGNNQIL